MERAPCSRHRVATRGRTVGRTEGCLISRHPPSAACGLARLLHRQFLRRQLPSVRLWPPTLSSAGMARGTSPAGVAPPQHCGVELAVGSPTCGERGHRHAPDGVVARFLFPSRRRGARIVARGVAAQLGGGAGIGLAARSQDLLAHRRTGEVSAQTYGSAAAAALCSLPTPCSRVVRIPPQGFC
jgi:hypothetical protein